MAATRTLDLPRDRLQRFMCGTEQCMPEGRREVIFRSLRNLLCGTSSLDSFVAPFNASSAKAKRRCMQGNEGEIESGYYGSRQ
eukprot:scaffold9044_cov97-Alexandrium_tamarense.AAC.2